MMVHPMMQQMPQQHQQQQQQQQMPQQQQQQQQQLIDPSMFRSISQPMPQPMMNQQQMLPPQQMPNQQMNQHQQPVWCPSSPSLPMSLTMEPPPVYPHAQPMDLLLASLQKKKENEERKSVEVEEDPDDCFGLTQSEYAEASLRRMEKITDYAHDRMEMLYNRHNKTSADMNKVIEKMHNLRMQISQLNKEDPKSENMRKEVQKLTIENKDYFQLGIEMRPAPIRRQVVKEPEPKPKEEKVEEKVAAVNEPETKDIPVTEKKEEKAAPQKKKKALAGKFVSTDEEGNATFGGKKKGPGPTDGGEEEFKEPEVVNEEPKPPIQEEFKEPEVVNEEP